MRAVVFTEPGPSSVLTLVDRDLPEPGPGEVRVRLVRAGVNPTDWKRRQNPLEFDEVTPGQDGAGRGRRGRRGRRRAGRRRPGLAGAGPARRRRTARRRSSPCSRPRTSYRCRTARRTTWARRSGVPAVTAHRALTSGEFGPSRLGPGALAGMTVLVAGGAGAVGNAAIQLARWSGATVVTTVSGPEKARAGHGRGRPPRRQLPRGRRRGGDPGGRAGRRGPRGRGGAGAEQRARPGGHQGARHGRDLRQQRRRRADRAAALDLLQEPPLPVPHPLHARRPVPAGRGRGRLRGGARGRAAGRRGRRRTPAPLPAGPDRGRARRRRAAARSARFSSILPPNDRTLVS